MDEQNKALPKAAVVSALEQQYNEALQEVETLLPQVGHGEAKRLLMAELNYPKDDLDTTGESVAFKQLYAASKRAKDALVGLATEAVIEKLIQAQQAEQEDFTKSVEEYGKTETEVKDA